jgi:hypothetical protein
MRAAGLKTCLSPGWWPGTWKCYMARAFRKNQLPVSSLLITLCPQTCNPPATALGLQVCTTVPGSPYFFLSPGIDFIPEFCSLNHFTLSGDAQKVLEDGASSPSSLPSGARACRQGPPSPCQSPRCPQGLGPPHQPCGDTGKATLEMVRSHTERARLTEYSQ